MHWRMQKSNSNNAFACCCRWIKCIRNCWENINLMTDYWMCVLEREYNLHIYFNDNFIIISNHQFYYLHFKNTYIIHPYSYLQLLYFKTYNLQLMHHLSFHYYKWLRLSSIRITYPEIYTHKHGWEKFKKK